MDLFELFFRFGAVALLLALAGLALRDLGGQLTGRLAAGLSLCICAYLLISTPLIGARLGPWLLPFAVLATAVPPMVWLLALALFDDQFRLTRFYAALAVVPVAYVLLLVFFTEGVFQENLSVGSRLYGLGLLGWALWVAWQGRGADLDEARRTVRVGFVVITGVYTALVLVAELGFVVAYDGAQLEVSPIIRVLEQLNGAAIFAVVAFLLSRLLQLSPDTLLARSNMPAGESPDGATQDRPEIDSIIDPADRSLFDRLITAMETEERFRDETLTIGSLAESLKAPEHHLRRLINRGLGYRNFNSYLNGYRIDIAKSDLSDPEKARLPVLTIAMDAGFRSLGPFNRAFKELTGQTPTEFRRSMLAETEKS